MNSIIILGLPGSGKSTYGRLLAERLGTIHISFGDIYRSIKSEEGNENLKGKELDEKLLGKLLEMVSPDLEWVVIDGLRPMYFNLINNLFKIKKIIKMTYDVNDVVQFNKIVERMKNRNREEDGTEEMIKNRIIGNYEITKKNEFIIRKFIKNYSKVNGLEYKEINSFYDLNNITMEMK